MNLFEEIKKVLAQKKRSKRKLFDETLNRIENNLDSILIPDFTRQWVLSCVFSSSLIIDLLLYEKVEFQDELGNTRQFDYFKSRLERLSSDGLFEMFKLFMVYHLIVYIKKSSSNEILRKRNISRDQFENDISTIYELSLANRSHYRVLSRYFDNNTDKFFRIICYELIYNGFGNEIFIFPEKDTIAAPIFFAYLLEYVYDDTFSDALTKGFEIGSTSFDKSIDYSTQIQFSHVEEEDKDSIDFSKSPNFNKDNSYENEFIENLALFVEDNVQYYMRKWYLMVNLGRKLSWNWAAFFFAWVWLAYRKMYFLSCVFLIILFTFNYLFPYSHTLIWLILAMILAIFANYLYYRKTAKSVLLIQNTILDQQLKQVEILRKGGTSWWGVIIITAILFLLGYLLSSMASDPIQQNEFFDYGI